MFASVRRAALLCLPFAAVFAALVTLSPRASAQYPGGGTYPGGGGSGGSYPGGGGTYPGSSLGWVPLARPGVTNPQPGGDFDWTGVSGIIIRTPFNAPPLIENYQNYGGSRAYSDNGSYFLEYPFNGTGGSGNTLAEVNTSFNGGTTYKWQWVPPNDAAGHPDLTNFPAPPLFALYDLSATLGTQATNGNLGLTATGSVSDGTPDGWSSSVSAVPQDITDAFPRRLVLLASAADSNNISSVVMALAGNMDVKGQQTVPQGGYVGPGGTAISGIGIAGRPFPITLSAPSPLTNPLLGDGTNQFVYDNIVPGSTSDQGHLFVDGTVLVAGASTADLSFLLSPSSKIDCTFDSGLTQVSWMVNPANYQWAISPTAGSSLQVMTSNATDWRIQETFPHYDFVFFQLPVRNSDFGPHTETLTVNANPSEVAHIQTFYLGKASNYPNAYDDYVNSNANASLRFRTPNWYNYYNQPYKATGSYTPITTQWRGSYCDPYTLGHEIYIKDDAFASGATHVFSVDKTDPNSHVKYAGRLGISGIFQYIDVCAHEKGHQDAWKPQSGPDAMVYTHATDNDINHDGVDDSWELHHHFDIHSPDTTSAYSASDLGNDIANQEVIADIPAFGAILANKAFWASDWAGEGRLVDGTESIGGVQWLRPAKAIRPGESQPDYYFLFYPVIGGDSQNGYTISTIGQKVWNLSDIQAIVSSPGNVGGTVLTSLP